jgi:riboflavin synthase
MFTGLIVGQGTIISHRAKGKDAILTVKPSFSWDSPLVLGESISVSGVCLTVSELGNATDGIFSSFASEETLSLTTLSQAKTVNLERALRLSDRLGGHLVSGHVDGTGYLSQSVKRGDSLALRFGFPKSLSPYLAPKGSIAVDGVSLTVNEVMDLMFTVNLIPETLRQTTLSSLKPGSKVNLEADLLARYAVNYLMGKESIKGPPPLGSGLDLNKLRELGY